MKLRCTIGSIGVVGTKINAQYGDVFEVADSIGENLVKSGYAEEIAEPPATVTVPDDTPTDTTTDTHTDTTSVQKPKSKTINRRRK